ncbi:jg13248 [Pararge aegeria aegeria]|uniref:Jg13248 protein n=1 Tax=Pararge aegeria aegeria TaxID=348720 RepID=A0A8S4RDI6_9NEOP|nr:jg13248 [Pararge aegeria aegeria]
MVNNKVDHSIEINCRIEQARAASRASRKMESILLCDRNLSLPLRTRVLRCYVFSVLLYGVETWTLTEAQCKKIEAFEIWVYRRMLRISWVELGENSRQKTTWPKKKIVAKKCMPMDREKYKTVKSSQSLFRAAASR